MYVIYIISIKEGGLSFIEATRRPFLRLSWHFEQSRDIENSPLPHFHGSLQVFENEIDMFKGIELTPIATTQSKGKASKLVSYLIETMKTEWPGGLNDPKQQQETKRKVSPQLREKMSTAMKKYWERRRQERGDENYILS